MNSGKSTIPGARRVAGAPRVASAPCVASALLAAAIAFGSSAASAQTTTWQTYRCGDGSEFIVGFFGYDKRAHMQVDGKAVTLQKRLALTGSRYSGGGVTLKINKAGATFKIGKRPVTSCQLT